MKSSNILLLSILVFLFTSCKKDEIPELVNSWKLIEILADPGDGSGTFQPVTSNKVVSFYGDGTVSCNGILCQMSTESGTSSAGSYSESEMTITPENCGIMAYVITYELQNSNLILNHPCFEPCREKYELVD